MDMMTLPGTFPFASGQPKQTLGGGAVTKFVTTAVLEVIREIVVGGGGGGPQFPQGGGGGVRHGCGGRVVIGDRDVEELK